LALIRQIDQIAIPAAKRQTIGGHNRAILLGNRRKDLVGSITAYRPIVAVGKPQHGIDKRCGWPKLLAGKA